MRFQLIAEGPISPPLSPLRPPLSYGKQLEKKLGQGADGQAL